MPYTFTAQEKEELKQKYLQNIAKINEYLPAKDRIKADVAGFEKKVNDPSLAWLYKKGLELKARDEKKKQIQDQLSEKLKDLRIPGKAYPLERIMHTELIASDDPEAMAYNEEKIRQYFLHPEAVIQRRFQKVFEINGSDLIKMAKCKDTDNLMLAYGEKHASTIEDAYSLVGALEDAKLKDILTPEMKEYLTGAPKNYEPLIDCTEMMRRISEGYFTVPNELTDAQDNALMEGNNTFDVDNPDLSKQLNANISQKSTLMKSQNEFSKYFKEIEKKGIDLNKDGPLNAYCIEVEGGKEKYVGLHTLILNADTMDGTNPKMVTLPPETVNGMKKIFTTDFTKEEGYKEPEIPAKFKTPAWKEARDEIVFRQALATDRPIAEIDNAPLIDLATSIKGSVGERLFNTTSREYKTLIQTMKDYDNPKHVAHHNPAPVKIAANQYLIHKGVKTKEDAMALPYPSKDRALLCLNMIESFQKYQDPNAPKMVPGTNQEIRPEPKREAAIVDPALVDDQPQANEEVVPNQEVVLEQQKDEPQVGQLDLKA